MRTRLIVLAILVVSGVIAVVTIRFLGTQSPAITDVSATSAATPSAIIEANPVAAGSVPPSSASPDASASAAASAPPTASGFPTASASPSSSVANPAGTMSVAPAVVALTSPTPTPVPTPTTDPNLLAMTNGAFVRRWTLGGLQSGSQDLAQNGGAAIVPQFAQPVVLLFELPSVAHVQRIGVTLRGAKSAHVDVAVSTDPRSFRKIGTVDVALPANDDAERFIDVAADARFVRFTLRHSLGSALLVARVAGYGTAGPAQRGTLSGTWVGADEVSGLQDAVFVGVRGSVPDAPPHMAQHDPQITTEREGVLSVFQCAYRDEAWHARVTNNVAQLSDERLQLAGNGNMLVGYAKGHYILALRAKRVEACEPVTAGTGATVLALVRVLSENPPELDPALFPGYRFDRRMVPRLDASQLQRARFAILDGDCYASSDLAPRQQRALLQWVAAGHKLIIRDADVCSSSDYSFLPYRFSTKAAGAGGELGKVLAIADPSTLGSGPNDPAHVIDVEAYLKDKFQQIGDADIIQTDDSRWCGHLFSTNATGASGWVHAYVRYGRGLIIYDGFDRDDLRWKLAPALRIVALEYAQPVRAELPCNARVASMLVLYPSTDKALPAGKPIVLRVPMTLANATPRKTAQDVTLSVAGDASYRASVSPVRVHLVPGRRSVIVTTLQLPAGWSGAHAYTVSATGAQRLHAQATIHIDGSVALAKAFESQRRVRIYGIHFDVDSAQIQPRSETTIAQIAGLLAAHRDWKMRVEGHTDSDGGPDYNKALSVRRGQAVVADLVARYKVARQRLTSAGFGMTRPVASNVTEAGKALNRRVELVRL